MRVTAFACAVAVVMIGACGGPQDEPPKPLSRHFDDMYIAAVPIEEKQAVIKTQNDWSVAKMEKAKADADQNEAGVLVDVAKNEREATRLDERSAQSRKKAAEQSADMTRINEANKEVAGTELARRAADERVGYLEAYRNWLKVQVRGTEHNMYWREAQFELAKARVARSKNIQPKGFVYEEFERQEADRAKKSAGYKDKVERERAKALDARTRWLATQGEADKLLGKRNQFPDPMAPKQVRGTDPTQGSGGYTVGQGQQGTPPPQQQPPPPPQAPSPGDGQ